MNSLEQSMMVSPEVQGQRDQMAKSLVSDEVSKDPTNPYLQKEMSLRFKNTPDLKKEAPQKTIKSAIQDPKFLALPPEAKAIVFDKLSKTDKQFQALSPEAQKIVKDKYLTPKEESQGALKGISGSLATAADMALGFIPGVLKTADETARYVYESAIKGNVTSPGQAAKKGAEGDANWNKYNGIASSLVDKALGQGTAEHSAVGRLMNGVSQAAQKANTTLASHTNDPKEQAASLGILTDVATNFLLPHIVGTGAKALVKGGSKIAKNFKESPKAQEKVYNEYVDKSPVKDIPKEKVVEAVHSTLENVDQKINEHIEAAPAPKEEAPITAPDTFAELKDKTPVVYTHTTTPQGHVVTAEHADTGEKLGQAIFRPHDTVPGAHEAIVKTEKLHEGNGVARGMYDHAKNAMGLNIKPSAIQTEAGKGFSAAYHENSLNVPALDPKVQESFGQGGFVEPKHLALIAGISLGAVLNPNNPIEGAAIGLAVTWLGARGIGRIAKTASSDRNLNLEGLAESYKPDLSVIESPKKLADALHWAKASSHADSEVISQHIDTAIKEGVTKEVDKMFRDSSEGSIVLNDKGKELYDRTVGPLRKVVNELRAKVGDQAADTALHDLGTRIALNHRTWLDDLINGQEMSSQGGKVLASKSGALKGRTVFATDDGHIVTVKRNKDTADYTYTFWKDGEAVGKSYGKQKIGDGDKIGDRTIMQAKQQDIEQNSPIRYVQSDLAVWGLRAKELMKYSREKDLVEAILNSKGSNGETLFPHESDGMHNIPEDYRQLTSDAASLQQFRGRYMPENLAEVLEDAARRNDPGIGQLINNLVTRSFMINFIPHVANEGVHWWDARGFSGWVTPTGIPRGASKGLYGLAKTLPAAFKSVVTQDKDYVDIMRHDGSLMSPSHAQQAHMEKILTYSLQQAIKSGSLKEIALSLGLAPVQLAKKISDASQSIMWGVRDTMYIQLVKEQELMGLPREQAIKETNRHMPAYQLPSRVLGSRKVSKIMQNPNVMFSRYHYGLLSSLGQMAKEIASPALKNSPNEFVKGMDRVLALGVAGYVLFPMFDYMYTQMFGDKGDQLKQRRAGPLHTFEAGQKAVTEPSPQNIAAFGMGILTPSPAFTMAPELIYNRNLWNGRPIMRPGSEVQDLARYAMSKIKPVDTSAKIQEGKITPKAAALELLDVLTKTEKQRRAAERYKRTQARLAAHPQRKHRQQ